VELGIDGVGNAGMVEQKRHEEGITSRPPRERLARARAAVLRGLKFYKGALLLLVLAGAVAITVAWHVQRVYRSECTVLAKSRIRTDDRDDLSPDAMLRQSARLKDMLTTRARLEGAIRKFGLYPEIVAAKTMLDAVEQMKPHVGFRALDGGQYVISFDGGDPETVRGVTEYLSESLIEDYASSDLADLQRETDFLAHEEQRSLTNLETATRALTLFLAAHPEFALEAKQAAQTPFGPSPGYNIPLMPKVGALGAAGSADPELAVLLRERSRLEGEAKSAVAVARGLSQDRLSQRPTDDQIAQTQVEVEAAAKRVAETQADLASKSNLTEDHPDMRAARMAADAAARQLHETKVRLLALQQLAATGSATGWLPGVGAAAGDASRIPAEIGDKLRQVDAQIVARRARLTRAPSAAASSSASGEEAQAAPPPSPVVAGVVELETDWQRLLRALNEAKAHQEDLKLRVERARLALEAARAQASERMAVIDPPYRPTHPTKGGRTNTALAGLAMALLLAIAYATVRATFDDTLVGPEDIESLGVAPVLGVVPRIAVSSHKEPAHARV
jgi:hypothetical protein